jgi:hypothetical protein
MNKKVSGLIWLLQSGGKSEEWEHTGRTAQMSPEWHGSLDAL